MTRSSWLALAPARQHADLSMAALFVRYVALGGSASPAQLSAHFASGAALSVLEHDTAVHALNERFLELHDPQRLPYEADDTPT